MPIGGEDLLDGSMGDDIAGSCSTVSSHDDAFAVTNSNHRGGMGDRDPGGHVRQRRLVVETELANQCREVGTWIISG